MILDGFPDFRIMSPRTLNVDQEQDIMSKTKTTTRRRSRHGRFLCLLWLTALLPVCGCSAVFPTINPGAAADRIAEAAGFRKSFITTGGFILTTFSRLTVPGDPLNIYVEGDGAAWLSRTRLSDDPTPRKPLVLALAAIDPAANLVYLARPGQYPAAHSPPCDPAYWSDRRFSRDVVEALNAAIDVFVSEARSTRINLIGYSGGAALAVLIALERKDVVSLRTVAGNLDPEAVNRLHGVSPLDGSLNPMDGAEKLNRLPQRHFVGSKDTVVPPRIARSFMTRSGRRDGAGVTLVEGATHTKGWRENWETLLAVPLDAGGS
jgi:pimeloyl-ACP methyl ester carboxylesterase